MSNPKGSFIWYELMTDDAAGAKAFYDAVVGWNVAAAGNPMPSGADYRMITRADGGSGGGVLALTADMLAHGARPGWLPYIYAADVDATAQALQDAGGAVHMLPSDLPVGRIAMVSDPWGATFYIMNPIPPAGQPDAVSDVFADKPQHVRWHDLWTTDQDAALALYGDLFDFTKEGEMPMGDGRNYYFIANGQGTLGGLGPALPNGRGARWAIYLGVDDIDRAIAAVEANGGTLDGQPNPVPDGDYAVHITDPQGAHVGIVGPRKE